MANGEQGRPTKYKPEYDKQAYKLCLLGHNDEELAIFFGVSTGDIASWAYQNESFFNAITPTKRDIDNFLEKQKKTEIAKDNKRKFKREWQRKKRLENPSFKIEGAVRSRMTAALKGKVKTNSIRDLPYTTTELISHLKSLFTEGMTMDNYGDWHVDHIKPCVLFNHTDKEQFLECWDLSNLQPLWAIDNFSKGSKYECT